MILMTVEQQNRVGRAARKVGGYGALIRLESERRAIREKGMTPVLQFDPDAGYSYTAIPIERPVPTPQPKVTLLTRLRNLLRPKETINDPR